MPAVGLCKKGSEGLSHALQGALTAGSTGGWAGSSPGRGVMWPSWQVSESQVVSSRATVNSSRCGPSIL